MLFEMKNGLFVLAIGLSVAQTMAQNTVDSLRTLQDNREVNILDATANPATLHSKIYPQYGFATVEVKGISGNFVRPMEAASSNALGIETGGIKRFNGWIFKTLFNYKKQYDTQIAWSGVNNAYEGNPFVWADSSNGNWERDQIKASINVASPLIFKKLTAGLSIDYDIGSGARLTEPKPFYRQRYIALQPGFQWQLTPTKTFGVAGKAHFLKEENELGFFGNNNVLLYRLRGFGTFSKSPFVSGERKRDGLEMQATAHYAQQNDDYQVIFSAFAAQRDEEVIEGIAIPQTTGYFTELRFGGNVVLKKGNAQKGVSVAVAFQLKDGFADDVIFNAESASYSETLLSADFNIWRSDLGKNALRQFTFSPILRLTDYVDQATQTQWNTTNVGGVVKYNWRKSVANLHFQIQPFAGYYSVVQSDFINRKPNVITKELITPDYQYFTSNYAQMGVTASLQINQPRAAIVHAISVNAFNSLVMGSPIFNNRNNFQLNYSIIF